jgi:hypothetical protein
MDMDPFEALCLCSWLTFTLGTLLTENRDRKLRRAQDAALQSRQQLLDTLKEGVRLRDQLLDELLPNWRAREDECD